jgi:signal peptidase II
MPGLKHLIVVFLILFSCVGCDQTTKAAARRYLPRNEIFSFAGDTLRLQYAENKGAFLSMGSALPEKTRGFLFTAGAGAFIFAALCYLLVSPLPRATAVALSLVCGGGCGNLIDRIAHGGYVIDFLNVGVGGLRTGIFNIADMAIMAGALLMVRRSARQKKTLNG